MRLLKNQFFNHHDRAHRWVGVNGPEAETRAEGDIFEKLKSPRSFGISDVRKLSEQVRHRNGELTAEEKSRLNELTEFHLSLVAENYDAKAPSHLLYELRYSPLWRYVRGPLGRRVDAVISQQRKRLQPLVNKDVSKFSNGDMHRFLRYYKSYAAQSRHAKLPAQEQANADKMAEKLVAHAHKLMGDFRIEDGHINPSGLKARDKFFILQVYRMFPHSSDWGQDTQTADGLRQFSQAVVQEVARDLSGTDTKQKIDYLPLWEIIDDLTSNEATLFSDLEYDQQQTLKRFATEARSAHVLNWVRNWQADHKDEKGPKPLLLPEHVQALAQIRDMTAPTVFGVDEDPSEVIKQWTKENGEIRINQTRGDNEEAVEAVEVSASIEKEKAKISLPEKFKAFEDTWHKFKADQAFNTLLSGRVTGSHTFPNAFIRNFQETVDALNVEDESWEAQLEEAIRDFEIKYQVEFDNEPEYRTDALVEKFPEKIAAFRNHPFGTDFSRREENARANIKKLEEQAFKQEDLLQEYQNLAQLHAQMPSEADKALKSYKKDLQGRVSQRQLTAADMAVLFNADARNPLELDEDDGYIETIKSFRNHFALIVDDIVQDVVSAVQSDNVDQADADRMRLWYQALDKAFDQESLVQKVEAKSDLKASFEALQSDTISPKKLLDSAIVHYRAEIYDRIEDKLNLRGQIHSIVDGKRQTVNDSHFVADYLSQYERMHHQLYDTSTRSQILDDRLRAYYNQRDDHRTRLDTAQHQLDERLGAHTASSIARLIEVEVADPSYSAEALVGEIDDLAVMNDLMDHDLEKSQFYQKVSAVIPAGRREEAMPRLAENYLKWQAKKRSGQTLKNISDHLNAGREGFPGRETYALMKLRSAEFEADMAVLHADFKHDVRYWLERLQNKEVIEHREMHAFLGGLSRDTVAKMESIARQLFGALSREFPEYQESFIGPYIGNITATIEDFKTTVDEIDEAYNGKDWAHGSQSDLERIIAAFLSVSAAFSMSNGSLQEVEKALESHLKDAPEAVHYLDDRLGLFSPGGKKKAEKMFNEMRDEYAPTFAAYKRHNEGVAKRLQKDLENLSPDDFMARHGMDKVAGAKMIKELTESAKDMTDAWKPFQKSGYFNDFVDRYQNPETQAQAINEVHQWLDLEESVPQLQKLNTENSQWNKRYDEGYDWMNTTKLRDFAKHWINPNNWFTIKYTFSLVDLFYRMPKKLMEAWERKEERRREKAVADIGTSLFGNSAVGREFQRIRWEEEDKRVKEFEGRYEKESYDFWEKRLFELRSPRDKDEARALINLLVNEGYMRWDKPALWKTLMALQSPCKVRFNVPDDLRDKSLEEIYTLVEDAVTDIWTKKIFTDWDGSLEGNHKKQMESNYKNFERMWDKTGALDNYFSGAIDGWRNGDNSVNPAEFEAFLNKAFEMAKYNSVGGDKRWFYLILGMTVKNNRGETLLSHEAKNRFNSTHLQAMPMFDFFTDGLCWKKDGMPVPEGTPGAHKGSWSNQDVQAWGDYLLNEVGWSLSDPAKNYEASEKFMVRFMMNSPNAILRADRFGRGAGKSQDHDDAWIHGMSASYQNLAQMLNRSSQGSDTISPDFAAQLPQAYDVYMKHTIPYIKEMDARYGADNPAWKKQKDLKLKEVGQMMRKMFFVVNSIAGNYHGGSSQQPQTIDVKYWEGNDNSTGVAQNRDYINEGMRDLLALHGDSIEEGMYKYIGAKEAGDNYKERQADQEYQRVQAEIGRVLGNAELYSDTDKIEQWIHQYAAKKGL